MRVALTCGAALVLLAMASLPACAQDYLENVQWEASPGGPSFARHFPPRAVADGVSGVATLDCVIKPDRRLDCVVASEEPEGHGFGQAALAIAADFVARPETSDGVSVIGARVLRTIRFNIDVSTSPETQRRTLPRGADLYWESGMITRFYPAAARAAGIEGRVELDCVLDADLRYDCSILSEDPAGHGFGAAALEIVSQFFIRPSAGEASPAGRRSVERIHFRAQR